MCLCMCERKYAKMFIYACVYLGACIHIHLSMYIHAYIQNTCKHIEAPLQDTVADEVYRFTNIYTGIRDLWITS